jgi:hypothetical protein
MVLVRARAFLLVGSSDVLVEATGLCSTGSPCTIAAAPVFSLRDCWVGAGAESFEAGGRGWEGAALGLFDDASSM